MQNRRQHRQLMNSGVLSGVGGAGLKFVSASRRFYFFFLQPEHIIPRRCLHRPDAGHPLEPAFPIF